MGIITITSTVTHTDHIVAVRLNPWVVVAIALVFIALAAYAVITGEAALGRAPLRMRIRRADTPIGFWLAIAFYLAIAVVIVFVGAPWRAF